MLTIKRLVRGGVLAATVLACAATPAQAQFGSLKNRVKQKVAEKTAEKVVDRALGGEKDGSGADGYAAPTVGPAAAGRADRSRPDAAAEPVRRSPYGEYVLEMTPEIMDRFATALAAERAERATIPTRKREYEAETQKFSTCYYAVLQSPEMEKLNARMAQAGEKNDMDLYMKVSQEQQELTRAKCGEAPTQPDYSRLALAKALEAGKFGDRQYDILKERVAPFCAAGATLTPDGDGVRVGGSRIAYVYSAIEVEQLRSRCGALTEALKAVL